MIAEKGSELTLLLLTVVRDVDDLDRFVSARDKVENYIFQKQHRATQTLMVFASGPP